MYSYKWSLLTVVELSIVVERIKLTLAETVAMWAPVNWIFRGKPNQLTKKQNTSRCVLGMVLITDKEAMWVF